MTNEQYIDKMIDKEAEMTSLKYQVETTWLSTQKKLDLMDQLLRTLRMRCFRHSSDSDVSDYLGCELWNINLVNVDAIDPLSEHSEDPFDKKLRGEDPFDEKLRGEDPFDEKLRGDETHEKCRIQELFESSSLSDLAIAEIINELCYDEYLKNRRMSEKLCKERQYDKSAEYRKYEWMYYEAAKKLDEYTLCCELGNID